MAAQSFSHNPGFSGRGGKSNLRSSSARSFRRFGPRLVSAMALEPKNANCWKPVIQLLLFLGYVKVSFKFPGHLLSNYVKPTFAELPFLLGLGVFCCWGVDLDGTQKVQGPTRFKICGREMSTLLKQI